MTRTEWIKKIGLFVALMVVFIILGNLAIFAIFKIYGIDLEVLSDPTDLQPHQLSIVKWSSTINHLIIFTCSSLVWVYFISKEKLALNKKIDGVMALYLISWLLFSFPLIAYAAQVNQFIPIPSWAEEVDSSTMDFLMEMLKMDGPLDLLVNIVVVALVPAIGEELLFRRVVLKELLKGMSNSHVAIVVTSVLFAFFHMQLNSFLPKFAIGLILGYAYYWTKNLWYPIMIHFFNNGLQVTILYVSSAQIEEMDEESIPPIPMLSIILSSILCAIIVDAIIKRSKIIDEGH
jgi:membrane protease YdiL (CAAX protease family)